MSLDFESTTDWAPTDWTAIGEDSLDDAITLRRAIHADPEVGLHCPRTSDKVKAALAGLPLEIREGTSTTGFVAILRGGRGSNAGGNGRTVLLHCVAAQSRTPSVAAAYAIRHLGREPVAALHEVCAVLPDARPNRALAAAVRRMASTA